MRTFAIISAVLFTIGNIVWPFFDEPKYFYVPQAFMITALILIVKRETKSETQRLFLTWMLLLSYGNIIKQVFYSEELKQINDYVYGTLVTFWLIFKLKLRWETHRTQRGGRR